MPDVQWSAFSVTFPAGKDVALAVRYDTGMTGEGSIKWLDYILETGAGWYGPIGSAVIIYRFPYAVGSVNILSGSTNYYLVGREVRFIAADFEPDAGSNIHLRFVDPAVWQSALDLESETGANPTDIPSIVSLAEIYEGMNQLHHDCNVDPGASQLAMSIIQEGLVYSPDSAELHAEWAGLYFDRMQCAYFESSMEQLQNPSWNDWVSGFVRELKMALALDPANKKALQLQEEMSQWQDSAPDLLSMLTPTAFPADTEENLPIQSTPTPRAMETAAQSFFPGATPLIVNTPVTNGVPLSGFGIGWVLTAGLGGMILGIGISSLWKLRK
jgi:hypothetical protein